MSHQPAKYRNVSVEKPTWVLSARVYTAPESTLSSVASSSLCWSIRSASLGGGKGEGGGWEGVDYEIDYDARVDGGRDG